MNIDIDCRKRLHLKYNKHASPQIKSECKMYNSSYDLNNEAFLNAETIRNGFSSRRKSTNMIIYIENPD